MADAAGQETVKPPTAEDFSEPSSPDDPELPEGDNPEE
jgi:hypothetical protein